MSKLPGPVKGAIGIFTELTHAKYNSIADRYQGWRKLQFRIFEAIQRFYKIKQDHDKGLYDIPQDVRLEDRDLEYMIDYLDYQWNREQNKPIDKCKGL